jgi:hypothetical protein
MMFQFTAMKVCMANDTTGKNETRNARALFAVSSQHIPGRTEKGHDKASVAVTDFRTGILIRGFSE